MRSNVRRRLQGIGEGITRPFALLPDEKAPFPYLDGLRAVAVLLVVVVHAWWRAGAPQYVVTVPILNYPFSVSGLFASMSVGIDLLFVLSGFLLAQSWLRADYLGASRPSLRAYFTRRFFRIAPAYYLCLFLTLLFFVPAFIQPGDLYSRTGGLSVVVHLLLANYAFPFSAGSWGVGSAFWIVTIEAAFWLTLPWTIRLFTRNRWIISLPVFTAVSMGWLFLCRNSLGPMVHLYQAHLSLPGTSEASVRYILSSQFPAYFVHFALGIAMANLAVRRQLHLATPRVLRFLAHPWAGVGYFVAGAVIVLYAMNKISWFASRIGYSFDRMVTDPQGRVPYYLRSLPFAIGFALMVAGLVFGTRWLRAMFSVAPLRIIGLTSYSLYLWHLQFIVVIATLPALKALRPADQFPRLLAWAGAALIIFAAGYYLLIEKPAILFGRTLASGKRSEADESGRLPTLPAPLATGQASEPLWLRPFVVASSSGAKVSYLDGIRAIAVLFVVLLHSWVLSGSPELVFANPLNGDRLRFTPFIATGFVGVELFFVLSGFLLSQSWIRADLQGKPRPSLRVYFRNRLFRILPAYYVCIILIVLFLTPFLIPAEFVYGRPALLIHGAHLFVMQFLFPLSSGTYNVNGSLWTLTIEMIFYLILPWAVLLFLRNRWIVSLPVLTLCSAGWAYLCRFSLGGLVHIAQQSVASYGVDEPTIRDFLGRQFPGHFAPFALGIVLANLYWQFKMQTGAYRVLRYLTVQWMGVLYCIAGWFIVLWTMNTITHNDLTFKYYVWEPLISLGFTLIVGGVIAGSGWLQGLYSLSPLRFIGIIGYSIFLWHMPLIYLFNKFPVIAALPPEQRFPRVLLMTTVAVLMLSTISYLAIEKRFMIAAKQRRVAKVISVEHAEVIERIPALPERAVVSAD